MPRVAAADPGSDRLPAELPAARRPSAALAAAERAGAQRPPRPRAHASCRASRRTWSPTTWASCAPAGWSRRGAARPTAATPTTALDLARCGELLGATGAALHPGLRLVAPPGEPAPRQRRARVLFLCTGNSARSQIAEALAEQLVRRARSRRVSAGSHPKPLHPNAVRVMRERGIDLAGRRSKHLDEFAGAALRLRDHALRPGARGLPRVPRPPRVIHWSIPDPAREPATPTSRPTPRSSARPTELATRIHFLLDAIDDHRPRRTPEHDRRDLVNVRYMVDDVDAASTSTPTHLGFAVLHRTPRPPSPTSPAATCGCC